MRCGGCALLSLPFIFFHILDADIDLPQLCGATATIFCPFFIFQFAVANNHFYLLTYFIYILKVTPNAVGGTGGGGGERSHSVTLGSLYEGFPEYFDI